MRLSHRLIGALVLGVALVSLGFAWGDIRSRRNQLRADLQSQAAVEAHGLEQTLAPAAAQGTPERLALAATRFMARAQATGVVAYDQRLDPVAMAGTLPGDSLALSKRLASQARLDDVRATDVVRVGDRELFVLAEAVRDIPGIDAVAIAMDATHIRAEIDAAWKRQALRLALQILLVLAVTMLLVRWSFVRPLARTAAWMQQLRTLGSSAVLPLTEGELFKPLAREVTHLVRSLESARASAQEEARLRDAAASRWTAERLRAHVREHVGHRPLFVVSNREPYLHTRRGSTVEVLVPASGLVTALEPVLRACDGTWLAHGSGDADREVVDRRDRLRVPPAQPEYTLRRVWLTKEEEQGYYYGFANEGLWPLCHIAHTRPVFRAGDWACYVEANRKFADATIDEMEGTSEPLVLVQDYHFAMLPRMLKTARPHSRVGVFWHIPWPNPEAFGICPWQRDLLDGLLGADLIGFHTQAHCNNFLETVERAVESQIDWEHFTARRNDHVTVVRPFPISVATPAPGAAEGLTHDDARAIVTRRTGVSCEFIGVGVDRIDYTKGIIERLRGLERFFEKWSHYAGRFTFVQIGAPSRTEIVRYRDLVSEVVAEAARINARFATATWKPVVLLNQHHDHSEIAPFYRAADVCAVTSLHDGMNLVAKEFVTARDDGSGVLILSQFTGAARELHDALIVNPYDTEQLADTFRQALEMSVVEQRGRMKRLRHVVSENNVYRWAARYIADLADIRVEAPRPPARFVARRVEREPESLESFDAAG